MVVLAIYLDRPTASSGSSTPRLRLVRARGLLGRGSTTTGGNPDEDGASADAQVDAQRAGSRRGLAGTT